jgi:hypothetical protein
VVDQPDNPDATESTADALATAAAPRRPYKLTPETLERYLDLLREGRRRGQAAREVGVHRSTIADHRKLDEAFAAEERLAEMDAVEQVEESLFQAALAGNVTAIQVFLYNRAPERWADKRNIVHTGAGGGPVEIADARPRYHEMTDAELAAEEARQTEALRREGEAAVAEANRIVRARPRTDGADQERPR